MSKSTYTYDNGLGCGCGCSGSKPSPGLGQSPIENGSAHQGEATQKDLIKTASDYINHEIPLKVKAGAITAGLGYIWWRSRKRR